MAKTSKRTGEALRKAVDDIVGQMQAIESFGKVAGKDVEGLSEMGIERFGIAVVTADGKTIAGGDADAPFPLQSISKVFALTIALRAFGDEVWVRVGREPSGDPFNSIIDLERFKGIPRNPFINAGALVVDDIVARIRKSYKGPRTVMEFLKAETGVKQFDVERAIVESDGKTSGFQNRALAHLAKGYKNLSNEVEDVMRVYVEQCAILVNCRHLARAGRYLMGVEDREEDRMARRINSMMLTCGQYDGSGDFAFRVGLPAKSGVGGGILAIAPGVASIAVWSPGLDENGNSILGTMALERLSEAMGWSIFG